MAVLNQLSLTPTPASAHDSMLSLDDISKGIENAALAVPHTTKHDRQATMQKTPGTLKGAQKAIFEAPAGVERREARKRYNDEREKWEATKL